MRGLTKPVANMRDCPTLPRIIATSSGGKDCPRKRNAQPISFTSSIPPGRNPLLMEPHTIATLGNVSATKTHLENCALLKNSYTYKNILYCVAYYIFIHSYLNTIIIIYSLCNPLFFSDDAELRRFNSFFNAERLGPNANCDCVLPNLGPCLDNDTRFVLRLLTDV